MKKIKTQNKIPGIAMDDKKVKLESLESDTLVSSAYLSECFGVNERTIQRYAKLDSLPRTAQNKYPLNECLRWYIQKLKIEIEKLRKESPLLKEKIMTQYLINKEKLINLRLQARQLVPAKTSGIITTNIVKILVSKLEALPFEINTAIDGNAATLHKVKNVVKELRTQIIEQRKTELPEVMKELEKSLGLNEIFTDDETKDP